jgi:hypothetical protein
MGRTRTNVVLVPLLLLVGCGEEPQAEPAASAWQMAAADDKSFSVKMPGEPKRINREAGSPQGKIGIHMLQVEDAGVTYTAGYSAYPPGFLEAMAPTDEGRFDRARDAALQSRQGTLLKDEKGALGRFPKRTVEMSCAAPGTGEKAVLTQAMVLAEGRMYITQTLAFADLAEDAAKDCARFHNSLKLASEP